MDKKYKARKNPAPEQTHSEEPSSECWCQFEKSEEETPYHIIIHEK